MNKQKALGYLSLAAKAGKLASGEFQTEEAVKKHRARVIVIAEDASENTKKKFRTMGEARDISCVSISDREEIGRITGKGFRAVCALQDENLAKAFLKAVNDEKEE